MDVLGKVLIDELSQYFTLPHTFRLDSGGVVGIQADLSRFQAEWQESERNPSGMVGMVGIW